MKRFRRDAQLFAGAGLIVAGVAWWSVSAGLVVAGTLIAAAAVIRQVVAMRNETGDL